LSKRSSTSQKSAAPRPAAPANRTSSGFSARSSSGLSEPAAQRMASDTFDLPEPFGPTMTPTPCSRRTSTGSGNDLKPRILTARRCTAGDPIERARRRYSASSSGASRVSGASSSRSKSSKMPRRSVFWASSSSRSSRFFWRVTPSGCQSQERFAGRLLFGGLLRASLPHAEPLAVHECGAREPALVRGSDRVHDDVVDLLAQSCQRLLQLRLVVDVGRQRVFDPVGERLHDRVLDRSEPVLEEERSERRLEQGRKHVAVVGETACVVAVGRRSEATAEIELAGDDGAARTRDDVRADLREPSLGEVWMPRVERVRDRELEHAVAEELEALVRGGGPPP